MSLGFVLECQSRRKSVIPVLRGGTEQPRGLVPLPGAVCAGERTERLRTAWEGALSTEIKGSMDLTALECHHPFHSRQ